MVLPMSAPARGASSPLNPPQLDLHWGERIGRYQVLAQLSVGGMAELFLGFTSGPGGFRKYVALKRILPDARSDEQFERMFLDEARITAALNHPNIVQVFELGQDGGGLFLAMEFIAGQNLDQVIALGRRLGGTLPLGFVLSVVRDVCLALHYAHTFTTPGGKPHPVIHRDVAHKNVMVTYDGVVKLLDFGIAKARDGAVSTQVGLVKGTTGYMSPEQVRGDQLDGRSDLFAAGVMLHEMLTGKRLFAAETESQEMVMSLEAPIPVPTSRVQQVPPEVSKVVMKALARDREERYPNGREMARALEAAAGSLLFDAEQRAAFMREHFQERMEVTRRLLESADEVKEPVQAETKRPVQGSQGARRGREAEASEAPVTKVVTTGRVVTREQPSVPTKEARSTQARARGKTGRFWGAIVVMLVLGGGLGIGALGLISAMEEQEASGTPLAMEDPSPMLPIERPGLKARTEPAEDSTAAKTQPAADAQEGGKEASTSKDGDGGPSRSVKQGALTLVILPEAEVFLNGRSLGKTPLIKTPVPVGKHLLRIKGADGKRRVLSVPIEVGKTAQFKLALKDIPEQ